MPIPSSDENKAALRRHCRSLVLPDPEERSRSIVSHLFELLKAHPEWQIIATFFPLHGEPDLSPLQQLLPERDFVYPRIEGSDMTFHHVIDPATQLIPTRWNLREPCAGLPLVGGDEIHVMLCPGTAFDLSGHRLGKGKGFYDRYLAATLPPRPRLIGVSFASFLFPIIPHESHDMMMDLIVTELGPVTQQ